MSRHTYPATSQDRMNYLLGLDAADQQISIALRFPDRLDEARLNEALRVSLKTAPVLSCRFVEDETPYWEHQEPEHPLLSVSTCGEEEADAEIRAFAAEPGDRTKAPMVQARLIRSASSDVLCVKISHLCSDGAGLKEYVQLLASVYTRLCEGVHPDRAAGGPVASGRAGFRDQSPVFQALGIENVQSVVKQDPGSASLWAFPSDPEANVHPRVAIRRLDAEQTRALIDRAKQSGATVNDALLAAYFRSLTGHAVYMEPRTAAKAVGITVDLRRYLPERTTGDICNLSGMETPAIEMDEADSFSGTLAKVIQAMRVIKENNPGLSSAAGMELLAAMPLSAAKQYIRQQYETARHTKMALPLLTNFGVISGQPLRFGNLEAADGYMTPPIMRAPFFSTGASSYGNRLTLAVGFHTPAVSEEGVNRLLDDMMRELTEWASPQ